jgi:predicted ATPase
MGWSHALCSPRERLLWARMSVFAGAFDLQAAEHVCSGGPLPAAAILDTVSGLVDKSILFREDHQSGVRYRILPTVGEFGAEWLLRLGELEETRRRHLDYSRWLQGHEQQEGP